MLRRIKSTLPFHFSSSLSAEDALHAASEGDIAYLTKFVEHVQLQAKMIKEEYQQENVKRCKYGLPRLPGYPRQISKHISVDEETTNSDLWRYIFIEAVSSDHIDILNLLYRSSCIVLNIMSKKELKIILGNVIHESTLGTLTFVFGALNINLNENRVLYKNLLMTALTAIHMSEYHYETVSEGKDRNHDLYFDRIVRVYDNFKYVAENCNVDKSYVLKCLMEVSKKYRDHSDLCLRLVKKIESQMQPMARANVVVTVSPPPELPSSHSNTQPRSLNDNNAFREDTKLKKKGGSVINSNLNESVQNSNLNVPAQNSNIESPIDYKCLTMEEAIEAARQGNIVVLQDLVQNMKHTIKKIELVNEETRRQGLEEYDYIRKASKRLEANSHLWACQPKCVTATNPVSLLGLR